VITPGVCQFCAVTDDQVDGDKLCWHDGRHTCCSRYACVKRYKAQLRQKHREWVAAGRKRSPAEIYELQQKERRDRNRRYREAAKAKGLLKPRGDAA
jgi:hypothetical protein